MNNGTSSNIWILGVTLSISGSTINALGWMLQKKIHIREQIQINDPFPTNAHEENQENEEENTGESVSLYYLKRWKWWIGFILYGIGSFMTSIALSFAPLSLLAPLESWTIVCNALLGHPLLHERLYLKDWLGILLILSSLIIAVLVGPKSSDQGFENGIADVADSYANVAFLCVAGGYSLIVTMNYILLKVKSVNDECILLLSFLYISAYFGAWNLLTVKCLMESIENSYDSKERAVDMLSHWLFYVLLFMWAFTMMTLEYWRQKALVCIM